MSKTGVITNHPFYLMMSCWPITKQVSKCCVHPESQAVVLQKQRQKSTLPEKLRNHIYQSRSALKRNTHTIICLCTSFLIAHTTQKDPHPKAEPAPHLSSGQGSHHHCLPVETNVSFVKKGTRGDKRTSLKTHENSHGELGNSFLNILTLKVYSAIPKATEKAPECGAGWAEGLGKPANRKQDAHLGTWGANARLPQRSALSLRKKQVCVSGKDPVRTCAVGRNKPSNTWN